MAIGYNPTSPYDIYGEDGTPMGKTFRPIPGDVVSYMGTPVQNAMDLKTGDVFYLVPLMDEFGRPGKRDKSTYMCIEPWPVLKDHAKRPNTVWFVDVDTGRMYVTGNTTKVMIEGDDWA